MVAGARYHRNGLVPLPELATVGGRDNHRSSAKMSRDLLAPQAQPKAPDQTLPARQHSWVPSSRIRGGGRCESQIRAWRVVRPISARMASSAID
jgi:hypothetical protein